jgi:hypothetical protein
MRASERDPHGPVFADIFQRAKLLPKNELLTAHGSYNLHIFNVMRE